jgi:hypothetical protein
MTGVCPIAMDRAVQCSTVGNAFGCVLLRTARRPDEAYSGLDGDTCIEDVLARARLSEPANLDRLLREAVCRRQP